MEKLEHGELEKRLVKLEEGEHDGEVHVAGVPRGEHVRGHPRDGLAHHLHAHERQKQLNTEHLPTQLTLCHGFVRFQNLFFETVLRYYCALAPTKRTPTVLFILFLMR